MSDPLTARVTELEARFTLQQDLLDKLSDVIRQQQRDLDRLVARVAVLGARGGGGETDAPDDVPPHY